METTKPKVDVRAIMARANKSVNKVKKSTEKVQSKIDSYKLIPNFSKFEFNGNILRNAKTKNIISPKTGRTKYQIFDDGGKSHNLNKEEIRALFPVQAKTEKVKSVKEKKLSSEPKVYTGEKHVVKPMELSKLKPDARKIMESDQKSYDQILALFKCNYTKPEIIEITGRRNDVVSKYLRPFLKRASK